MPETPKFKKKSTVKSFFSRIASSIARENIQEVRPTEQNRTSYTSGNPETELEGGRERLRSDDQKMEQMEVAALKRDTEF